MLETLLQALELSAFSALPVPMLRQVYVEPSEGAFRAPSGPVRAPREFSRGRFGPSHGVKNVDFVWEVLPKWQDGDIERTC